MPVQEMLKPRSHVVIAKPNREAEGEVINLYQLDKDREKHHDILVLKHSNKINFEVFKKVNRKSNKTSTKSKKGGKVLEPTSVLAIIETETENFPVQVFGLIYKLEDTQLTIFSLGCSSWEADLYQLGDHLRQHQAFLPPP